MNERIWSKIREHIKVFRTRHENGRKSLKEIDEILVEIKRTRKRLDSSVIKADRIINGGSENVRVVRGSNN
jgi:hypothetical protein